MRTITRHLAAFILSCTLAFTQTATSGPGTAVTGGGTAAGAGNNNGPLSYPSIGTTALTITGTAGAAGVTQYAAVVYDGATGNVVTAPTGALGFLGFARTTAASTASVEIAVYGDANCYADNTVVTGDLLGIGTTTAGACKDLGVAQTSSVPNNIQVIGRALSGGTAGQTISVFTVGAGIYGTQTWLDGIRFVNQPAPNIGDHACFDGVKYTPCPPTAGNEKFFYLSNTASDIGTYDVWATTPVGTQFTLSNTIPATTTKTLIEAFASASGVPNLSVIPAGVWQADTYVQLSSAANTTTLNIDVYKRATGGAETLLFSFADVTVSGNGTAVPTVPFSVQSTQPAISLNASDRLVLKYNMTKTGGASITGTIYGGGTNLYSHVHTPIGTGATAPATIPFQLPAEWIGTIPSSTALRTYVIPQFSISPLQITIPAGCAAPNSQFYESGSASTGSTTFLLKYTPCNTVTGGSCSSWGSTSTICTATVAAGATVATFSGAGITNAGVGRFEVFAGGDFTLGLNGISSITFAGTQTGGQ